MPLDSTTYTTLERVETQRIATAAEFWAATPCERLVMLSFALRRMPDSHAWDFRHVDAKMWTSNHDKHCGTTGCAIGLGRALWGTCGSQDFVPDRWRGLFGLKPEDGGLHFWDIYGSDDNDSPIFMEEITAPMVADAIDSYLARTP